MLESCPYSVLPCLKIECCIDGGGTLAEFSPPLTPRFLPLACGIEPYNLPVTAFLLFLFPKDQIQNCQGLRAIF